MIFKLLNLVIGVVFLLSLCKCKTLPKYINKCSIKDPEDFSTCALKSAKEAIPKILEGDKEHKIPKLVPWEIPFLHLHDGSSLNLTLSKTTVGGIETIDVKSIGYDKASKKMTIKLFFEHVKIDGHYTVQGKILVLPIAGEGRAIVDFKKVDCLFNFNLKPTTNKNGKEVARVENLTLDIGFGGATFNLDNLFNGDKALGDQMNKFLNENWKEITAEFQDLIKSPITSLVTGVASGILNNLSFNSLFDDA